MSVVLKFDMENYFDQKLFKNYFFPVNVVTQHRVGLFDQVTLLLPFLTATDTCSLSLAGHSIGFDG